MTTMFRFKCVREFSVLDDVSAGSLIDGVLEGSAEGKGGSDVVHSGTVQLTYVKL
jgi:hypothetical protein